jgi:hypothetical protein
MLQSLKQSVARTLALRAADSFWQARYYDFNVSSERKFVEKLRCIHGNSVEHGLGERPEDWKWSSFRHYLTGADGVVEIESRAGKNGESYRQLAFAKAPHRPKRGTPQSKFKVLG